MALTWKNVDAPNLGGTADLFAGANNSFNSAMDILRKTADRTNQQRRATTSAQMLQQLVGVNDPNAVGALISQFDAENLSPEALQIAMSQPGVLLDRQAKEVALQNAQGDLQHEQDTRMGQAEAARVRAQAQAMSMAGDAAGAAQLLQSLENPHAINAALGDFSSLGSNADQHTSRSERLFDFGRKVDSANISDAATDYFHNNIMPNVVNKDQARAAVMRDETLTPKMREKLLSQVDGTSDEYYQIADPDIVSEFASNPLGQEITARSDYIGMDIGNVMNQSPIKRYQDTMRSMDEDTKPDGTGFVDARDFLVNHVGVSNSGWLRGNPEIAIKEVVDLAAKEGLTISDKEAAAAIASSYDLGMFNSENRIANTENAVNIIKDYHNPETMRDELSRERFFRDTANSLENKQGNLQRLMLEYEQYSRRGMQDKAAQTQERIISAQEALVNEMREYDSKRNEFLGRNNSEPEAGTPKNTRTAPSDVIGGALESSISSAPIQGPISAFDPAAMGGDVVVPPAPGQAKASIDDLLLRAILGDNPDYPFSGNYNRPEEMRTGGGSRR